MRGVFAFLFVFVFIGAADALQSCLALSTSTECEASVAESGYVDWSAECAGSYTIRGIAGCSVFEDSYTRADKDLTQEVFCFCKVFAPYESNWVYSIGFGSASDCYANCSYYCASAFAANEKFRESIINVVK